MLQPAMNAPSPGAAWQMLHRPSATAATPDPGASVAADQVIDVNRFDSFHCSCIVRIATRGC